jgi:tetratricopeptide (TPR) repeat protein
MNEPRNPSSARSPEFPLPASTAVCRGNRVRKWLVASLSLVGALLLLSTKLGCDQAEPESSLPDPLTAHRGQGPTQLQQAIGFLDRLDEFDSATAHAEILRNLQEWLSRQDLDADWSPDPLSQQLPDDYLNMVAVERLARPRLEPYDALVLQEATWLRDMARAVVERKQVSPDISRRLDEIEATVPAEHAGDVGRALLLFDWTARNLQLDHDVHPGDTHRLNSDVILYAWESLLFGRGTFLEKSRVFLLMCRQLNLPVVMLAIDREDLDQPPQPWLPALLLDDQLYLFDTRLGLPVPNPDGRGVATLAQVIDSPESLEALEVFPDHLYPVKADDLEEVVALIDATPPDLSRRMAILEDALVGDQKLVLTTAPEILAEALADSVGVQGVGIWTLPYDGFVVRSRIQQNNLAVMTLALEHSLFDRQTPLAAARILHLRGQYDSTDDRSGAQALYLECRTPEQQIRAVESLPIRTATGEPSAAPTPQEMAAHERRVANLQFLMRRTKENASLWLGLMAYDRGAYDVSIDFLERRLLQLTPDTPWQATALYNLGRAYEARGHQQNDPADLQQARQRYESVVDSPLAAACQLRARALQQELQPTDPGSPPAAAESDESPGPQTTAPAPADEAPADAEAAPAG